MAEQNNQQINVIYDEKTQNITSNKDGKLKTTFRKGTFLKPIAKSINEAIKIPNSPLISEILPQNLQKWPSKVHFKGWRMPQRRWKEWVEKLASKYGPTIWIPTGIFDTIMSSTYEVRSNHDLVLGLSEFWCAETNTFLFPWGEATVTLEDIMILGGFPVLGDPVTSPLTVELEKLEDKLNEKRLELSRSKARKTTHSNWLEHFLETESELEHVAFLSLWLSRFVFPNVVIDRIENHVFSIAVHLASGTPMALAQAVLATLYHNLRLLKEQAIESVNAIVVAGPFQLIQLWAFEHFPILFQPNELQTGEPRIARFAPWHKLNPKITIPLVRSIVKLLKLVE